MSDKNVLLAHPSQQDFPLTPGYRIVYGYETILHHLQNSGDSIEKLIFHGISFTSMEKYIISLHIAKLCPNLIDIKLHQAGNVLLTESNQSFANVASIYIDYITLPENLQIHRIYPELQEFTIKFSDYNRMVNLNRLNEVLPRISQLQTLRFIVPSKELVQLITDNLVDLNSLKISYEIVH